MKKTNKQLMIAIIILLLLVAGFLTFFLYKATDRIYQQQNLTPPIEGRGNTGCQLMVNEQGAVNCFGCSSGKSGKAVCNDPSPEFTPYKRPEGSLGIPYSCYEGPTGCELAQ